MIKIRKTLASKITLCFLFYAQQSKTHYVLKASCIIIANLFYSDTHSNLICTCLCSKNICSQQICTHLYSIKMLYSVVIVILSGLTALTLDAIGGPDASSPLIDAHIIEVTRLITNRTPNATARSLSVLRKSFLKSLS